MAPKSPWKQVNPRDKSNLLPNATVSDSTATAPVVEQRAAQTDYDEAQKDEIEALSAIYQDDFHWEAAKGAWNKTTGREFTLRLNTTEDESFHLLLCGTLTATYPKSLPLLSIRDSHIPSSAHSAIEALLKSKPKELLGEVMIYEIATAIVDILDDAAQKAKRHQEQTDALPSLEEERAVKEAEAVRQAEQDALANQRKREAEQAEEARDLQQLVEREMSRRQEERSRREREAAWLRSPGSGPRAPAKDVVDFQRPIIMDIEGTTTAFSTVDRLVQIRHGPLTTVFTAQPVTADTASIDTCLVLKKLHLQTTPDGVGADNDNIKKAILKLEGELETLKRLRHDSAINLIEFEINSTNNAWQINLLIDYANKGSLREMLEMVSVVPPDNVRIWTLQILEALDFYHRNGVVHGRIHSNNVLISRSMVTGGTAAKLSDAIYQDQLHSIVQLAHQPPTKSDTSITWLPPECTQEKTKTRKMDVYEAGVVFVQMLFGLDATHKYNSPTALINSLNLSEALEDVLINFLREDPKRRHNAFDLLPSEFFRSNAPVYEPGMEDRITSMVSVPAAFDRNHRSRRGSNVAPGGITSRFSTEWDQLGRLGKGGYGEVVKARNKLDGRIYAIKKIVTKSPADLTVILSEVMLLSRLNNAYVVRYYNAWPEEEFSVDAGSTDEEYATIDTATTDELSLFMRPTLDALDFGPSSRGLDFISSSGPQIQFGADTDSDEAGSEAVESEDENASGKDTDQDLSINGKQSPLGIRRTTSSSRGARPIKSTLYIQMEFCVRRTLRDLIIKDLSTDSEEAWRIFRQVLEGLTHIHGQGIIHRDLKPDNVFIDVAGNPKIGDFGLATSGQYASSDQQTPGANTSGDMTRSVGTALYVAPELSSSGTGSYNEKVDMYSLGIIFFEMCHYLKTSMERDSVLRSIRKPNHELTPDFTAPEKALQGEIVLSLINHKPSDRPSSSELLRSGKVPVLIEDETIQEALRGFSDPSSPYYQKIMSALFSQPPDSLIKDVTWDLTTSASQSKATEQTDTQLLLFDVKARLTTVFKRHGAIELQRQSLFPLSHHYTNSSNDVVKLLDPSGCMVQLPYDLTLPNARQIAHTKPPVERLFVIGHVFRHRALGAAPRVVTQADFDIVCDQARDLALKEAETIKVVDEVVEELPGLEPNQMCFHIGHSDLLEAILEFCRIPKPQRPAVKDILSKLNIYGNTWQKVRAELRAPSIGIVSTSLDDLARFDFRDVPEKAFQKISSLLDGSSSKELVQNPIKHLRTTLNYMKLLNIRSKIFVSPLSSYNEKLYQGGMLFQCLTDNKTRDVIAAGGRYDRLVDQYRARGSTPDTGAQHAVGVHIGCDRLVPVMRRYYRNAGKKPNSRKAHGKAEEDVPPSALRRCDVLVASFDAEILRSTAVKVLAELWANSISAELADGFRSIDELQNHYREERFSWIVMVKQDSSSGIGKPELKVRNLVTRDESEVFIANLVAHLAVQLRDRDRREATTDRDQSRHLVRSTNSNYSDSFADRGGNSARQDRIKVLFSQHRSKKSNKFQIVQAADARAKELLASYANAPILAVECGEQAMDGMRGLRIGDAEGWKRMVQSAPLNERQYLGQIQDELETLKTKATSAMEGSLSSGVGDDATGAGAGVAFVYNLRNAVCLLFELL